MNNKFKDLFNTISTCQSSLARKIGVSPSAISRAIKGDFGLRPASIKKAIDILASDKISEADIREIFSSSEKYKVSDFKKILADCEDALGIYDVLKESLNLSENEIQNFSIEAENGEFSCNLFNRICTQLEISTIRGWVTHCPCYDSRLTMAVFVKTVSDLRTNYSLGPIWIMLYPGRISVRCNDILKNDHENVPQQNLAYKLYGVCTLASDSEVSICYKASEEKEKEVINENN